MNNPYTLSTSSAWFSRLQQRSPSALSIANFGALFAHGSAADSSFHCLAESLHLVTVAASSCPSGNLERDWFPCDDCGSKSFVIAAPTVYSDNKFLVNLRIQSFLVCSCGCRSIIGHGTERYRCRKCGNNDQVATINIFHILEISVKSGKDRVSTPSLVIHGLRFKKNLQRSTLALKLRKPSIFMVSWVSPFFLFVFSASTAATKILTAPTCTATIIHLEPCALTAEIQYFALSFSISYWDFLTLQISPKGG